MEIAEALKRLLNYIKSKELIRSGDKLILGCSGGADSCAMVYLFSKLRHELNISLLAVHVNHQLRAAESDGDEEAVKHLCMGLNIPIIIRKVSVPRSGNLENNSRKLRFQMFEQVMSNYMFDKILLAHHSGDQAETVLINFIRGAGVSGMAGIKPVTGKIVHPMLCFSRNELENLLGKACITWRVDSSNLDNYFSRNRLRNDLIPKLEQEHNPVIKQHLAAMAEVFLQADLVLSERSKKQFKRVTLDISSTKISLDLIAMIKLQPIERYYIMRSVFRKLSGIESDFMSAHFLAIEDVLTTGGSKMLMLPHGVKVKKLYEELVFYQSTEASVPLAEYIEINQDRAFAVFGDYRFSFKYLRVPPVDFVPEEERLYVLLDADKIHYPFRIRYRKAGDRFIPFGMNQFKRLKEFFIDEKVPKYDRDSLPIFDDGEVLFWIVGHRIDNRVRRDENSVRYLQIIAEPSTASPKGLQRKKVNERKR